MAVEKQLEGKFIEVSHASHFVFGWDIRSTSVRDTQRVYVSGLNYTLFYSFCHMVAIHIADSLEV